MSAERDRNLWLDMARGLSALAVCLGHLRNALLVDFGALEHPGILVKAFYTMTGLGHQSVMVFFVLSGYFVGGGILRSRSKFIWSSYLSSRLTRLWVVLIPCLVLTWFIDQTVNRYVPGVLSGENFDIWHSGPKPGEYSTSLHTFLANVFFLQTIESPVFGSNGPLWSLANEFWYYILFPLVVFSTGIAGSGKILWRSLAFVLALVLAWWLPEDLLYGFLIWMMGVAVYLLQPWLRSLRSPAAIFAAMSGLLLFCLSLGYSKSAKLIEYIAIDPDFLVGLSFSVLCLALTYRPFPAIRYRVIARLSLSLSEMSYSLYVFHFPIVVLIASIAYQSQKLIPDGLALTQFMAWSSVLIGLGFMVYWLFEARTYWVRTVVRSWINQSGKLSP
jgi:peptidoglycan/LPS O-acetylase OafA/YrhL